jgi:hypothetical protein
VVRCVCLLLSALLVGVLGLLAPAGSRGGRRVARADFLLRPGDTLVPGPVGADGAGPLSPGRERGSHVPAGLCLAPEPAGLSLAPGNDAVRGSARTWRIIAWTGRTPGVLAPATLPHDSRICGCSALKPPSARCCLTHRQLPDDSALQQDVVQPRKRRSRPRPLVSSHRVARRRRTPEAWHCRVRWPAHTADLFGRVGAGVNRETRAVAPSAESGGCRAGRPVPWRRRGGRCRMPGLAGRRGQGRLLRALSAARLSGLVRGLPGPVRGCGSLPAPP